MAKTEKRLTKAHIDCTKEELVTGLKHVLIGYQKSNYGIDFEFIQDEDFDEIAQNLIDYCN